MNYKQLNTIIGKRIVQIEPAFPGDKFVKFNATLDDGTRLQVLFFEEHAGTVKILEKSKKV